MTSSDFQTTTHGKWILAGEHAVLRGFGALVFPIKEKQLTLRYEASSENLTADFKGSDGEDLHLLFWSVLEHGMQILGKSINHFSGHFTIQNNIPIGVGMGASAALSVAVTRWFEAQGLLEEYAWQIFAKQLENLFHGKSSGLDIAGVAAHSGLYFQNGQTTPIIQHWKPIWCLSSSDQIGITSHCITQVNHLLKENPLQAKAIDEQMNTAVIDAKAALSQSSPNAIVQLAKAINLANDCFKAWGLISDNLAQHMRLLKEAGALAVKPTGSGNGGYVVSLWDKHPDNLAIELILV
ncbi:mevalonate kinase family protein [Legionella impletisoli]|uniref:Mevalonate kinase n=1 Tax=Legionella impletisoli TaxID=343510 RepID=A0A917NC33_9GAMM|nr:mevalonate kinase [Legionella impletisoli]GGI82911.1 mevalonate kinase [Legionella impletisoli]